MRTLILSAIAIASFSSISHAATFGVTPQVGLAGAGATVQWGFNEYLALSAGYTGLDRSISDVKTDDATYDADISIKNPQLFVNWAPFGGHFRMSFGVIAQNSKVDLRGRDFDPASGVSSATVKAEFAQSIAPAFTLGWETPLDKVGFGYHFSVGAMYAGKPEVNSSVTCVTGIPTVVCDAKSRDERENIEDELSKYKVLPILQAGVLYRL